jgi:hypothetical protein
MGKMAFELNFSSNATASQPMNQFILSIVSTGIFEVRQTHDMMVGGCVSVIRTKSSRQKFENWEMEKQIGYCKSFRDQITKLALSGIADHQGMPR